ncbi:biotin--[acetyl-CoA-carboxylase] ligase 3 [Heterostelium album PN500]|uniref:Biotin--[acetyl-CoA-carboxylase] ligase 3 n=1 Tax=Heterostelium pallidum (strain ATCC 26659 / Pp 5 / PN500) TaxID=670386 RepID=D3AWR9_HETP5|nr:biotin--[acetyl-CoA-carboxylase] ligase 3 [Heterostelium album PN500]EFA86742.1 biotin--[acetyl-CoA-carboxylase] ligase 3 [Heterostelium album PN500]|eukprot:XP_020438846.1 biotin--[acetyl-CoA-carboxylase] ligase 3 [Heterostelium album PN500]
MSSSTTTTTTASTSEIVRLYHKQKLSLEDTKVLYANEEFPGHSVPTVLTVEDASKAEESTTPLIVVLEKEQSFNTVADGEFAYDTKKYFDGLHTLLFGQHLLYAPLLSSTQTIMMSQLTFTGQGLVLLADLQNHAKGRGSNLWSSPPGCLTFSFKCKQEDGTKLPFLQYLVGLAMIKAIGKESGVRLKWPNDIYAPNKQKIGGILCQSNHLNGKFDVVVGVGLNVANDQPTYSLEQLAPGQYTRETVLAKFFNEFENMYIKFTHHGFVSFAQEFMDVWLHTNQVVTLAEQNQTVKVIGLSPNGFLQAAPCDGEGNIKSNQIFELHPDGTSFDLAHLTIKKKQ